MRKKNTTETKWVIFQQWCEVHPTFLRIKNYSNVYKEMSALLTRILKPLAREGREGFLHRKPIRSRLTVRYPKCQSVPALQSQGIILIFTQCEVRNLYFSSQTAFAFVER